MIKVGDHELDIDVMEEIEPYIDQFGTYVIRGNKLQGCSVFREERNPSFALNLENGLFIDSGSTDDYYRKGNFVKLLSFLSEKSIEETTEYLLTKFKKGNYTNIRTLDPTFITEDYFIFSPKEYSKYSYRHPYLEKRGITEKVQSLFRIGFDISKNAISIPHYDKKGNIINVKFRSVHNKSFWYLGGGQPIKRHLYGLHMILRGGYKEVYLVESEIDCLYLISNKVPAVAFAGANMSKAQKDLLISSPIERVVIATDNDDVGRAFRDTLCEELMGYKQVFEIHLPKGKKDVNELNELELEEVIKRKTRCYPKFINQ